MRVRCSSSSTTLPEDDPPRAKLRDELVEIHLPLVEYLARRFRNRGEPLDDLVQVATIGLIKSVDRFDLDREVEFSTYATPTIVGEIKRHFRDKGWAIRVPRRLQELKLSLTKATSELSQKNGRAPTVAELAAHLGMTDEEILEGLESANAYSAVSLDAPDGGDDDSPAVADSLGMIDEALEGVEYRESLKPLLEKLPAREKRILMLRFFGGMTQSQIAVDLGHQPDARVPAAGAHPRPAPRGPARRGLELLAERVPQLRSGEQVEHAAGQQDHRDRRPPVPALQGAQRRPAAGRCSGPPRATGPSACRVRRLRARTSSSSPVSTAAAAASSAGARSPSDRALTAA